MEQHEADLAELRTTVLRAREQALQLAARARSVREALAPERERIREERARTERELRDALRLGQLGPEQRALAERLDRGETSWRAIMSGEDQHWSAVRMRDDFSDRLTALVEEVREQDPEFRAEHDTALRAQTETPGGSP